MLNSVDIRLSDEAFMPVRAHEIDAGADLFSVEEQLIHPGMQATVKTGVSVDIPENHVGLLFSRSGMGKRGGRLANCVGVIDAGYQGEIAVMIRNDNAYEFMQVVVGDKIAQLVIVPCITPKFRVVSQFKAHSQRGSNGFGSTG